MKLTFGKLQLCISAPGKVLFIGANQAVTRAPLCLLWLSRQPREIGLKVNVVHCHDDLWLATEGRTKEEEQAAALNAYAVVQLSEAPQDVCSGTEWDPNYEESDDESETFSVYNDISE